MRLRIPLLLSAAFLIAVALASAQGPPGKDKKASAEPADPVAKLMTFDKNKDGKLSKDELTDQRLHALFDRADANKDGFVTPVELKALFAKEALPAGGFGFGFGGPGGPGGKGGFGPGGPGGKAGFGPGGPGGKGGFGGPPRPGQILPAPLQTMLKLTADQQKQINELQKEVDRKLDQILTAEQKRTLKQLRERGPGGFGPPPPPPGAGPMPPEK